MAQLKDLLVTGSAKTGRLKTDEHLPSQNELYDIGSLDLRWRKGYFQKIIADDLEINGNSGFLPVYEAKTNTDDMNTILKQGSHLSFYTTNSNTLNTPFKNGITDCSEAAILSFASSQSYGLQVAFLSGNNYPVFRVLGNGNIYDWNSGFIPLQGTTIQNPNTSSFSLINGLKGDLVFDNTGATPGDWRGIGGVNGSTDGWAVRGYQTDNNKGCLELAVGDDGDEMIYARQYTSQGYQLPFMNKAGADSGLNYREIVLMDASGNTRLNRLTTSYLNVLAEDSADEGGQMTLAASSMGYSANIDVYRDQLRVHCNGYVPCYVKLPNGGLYGAVWNDYAEYRQADSIEPGRCIIEKGDDTLTLSTKRMQPGAEIISDTFGFAIGETDECKTPIAATGRVLAYTYEDREIYKKNIGKPVCSGPNGTVSLMTDEEYQKYGYCAIGTVSAVPEYETWGTGNVEVNNRVWIRIR